jgi:Predicted oxidoreductases (related to aryl-alcohol dehydrogenases)
LSYIDLYHLHCHARNVHIYGKLGHEHEENDWNRFENDLENLKKFVDQGIIRYVGLSNETP